MARSKSFFGLRKGSTKAHTYSVWEGKQVTKDRAQDVKNPQTSAQMKQRLTLPLVAAARARLKELVNHSFEGVAYGDESLRYFSSRNLEKQFLHVKSYVPKGASDCGLADFQVSKGSLPEVALTATEKPTLFGAPWIATNISLEDGEIAGPQSIALKETIEHILEHNADLQKGDQLTFLATIQGGTYTYMDGDLNQAKGYYHNFVISRLILDPDTAADQQNSGKKWTLGETDVQEDDGHTQNYLDNGYIRIEATEDGKLMFTVSPSLVTSTTRIMEMGTVIVSRKVGEEWKRSNARMLVSKADPALSYNDVLPSYLKAKGANKYLNTGNQNVSLDGGTISMEQF